MQAHEIAQNMSLKTYAFQFHEPHYNFWSQVSWEPTMDEQAVKRILDIEINFFGNNWNNCARKQEMAQNSGRRDYYWKEFIFTKPMSQESFQVCVS